MLNKTEEELASFYPEDEIIKEYGEALMKYSEKGFIYPYTHDEEQKMIHNTDMMKVLMLELSKLK